jgi:hypothetical protein
VIERVQVSLNPAAFRSQLANNLGQADHGSSGSRTLTAPILAGLCGEHTTNILRCLHGRRQRARATDRRHHTRNTTAGPERREGTYTGLENHCTRQDAMCNLLKTRENESRLTSTVLHATSRDMLIYSQKYSGSVPGVLMLPVPTVVWAENGRAVLSNKRSDGRTRERVLIVACTMNHAT